MTQDLFQRMANSERPQEPQTDFEEGFFIYEETTCEFPSLGSHR